MWGESKEPYVFPKHCNKLFFYPYVLDRDWWFILIQDPISKHVCEKNNAIMPTKEDIEGNENEEWYLHVLFHHLQIEISFCYCYIWLSNYIVYFSCYNNGNEKFINGYIFKQFDLANNQYDVKYISFLSSNL